MAAAISAFDSVRAKSVPTPWARDEQAHRLRFEECPGGGFVQARVRRHREREHHKSTLAGNAQRLSTGHEDFRTIASGHESGHCRRRADDLFEVVQDQQQLPLVQSIDEALEVVDRRPGGPSEPRQWRAPPGPGPAAKPG